MNKDIQCKHEELRNLMRVQEADPDIKTCIYGIAESPKENWKDTENKLRQMLYDY